MSPILQAFALCAVSWFFWKFFRQMFVKSPLDNIPGPSPKSFLLGNLEELVSKNAWALLDELTHSYGGVSMVKGLFGNRMLYVYDPTALHHVIVKDQYIYEEAEWFLKSNLLTLGPGLLGTLGDRHRKQRKLLNPVFSIAHMRRMIPIFNSIGHKLQDAIETRVAGHAGPVEIDMLSWMGRTALELIGQTGLGYSFDPLVGETPNEFAIAVKAMQPAMLEINVLRRLLPYLPDIRSPIGKALQRKILDILPHRGLHKAASIVDTMHRISLEIYHQKKRAFEEGDDAVTKQIGEGKDIMSLLMRANMAAAEEDKLPEDELLGQMTTLIFAAMDTTSNALSLTLSLLAEHPDVQEKLRNEIIEASNGDDLGYDDLVDLPYLDAVCRETLRLYPPVSTVFREARQDIVLPLSEPIRGLDGKMIKEIPVPKDTMVMVAIRSSNRNKAVWGEDALEWKPERWLSSLPDSVSNAKIPGVYSNLMTFIGGGRACIGFKFSQLEMKVVLALLLTKFTFKPSDKRIVWNSSGIQYPSVANSSKPELPLMVGLYKQSATA